MRSPLLIRADASTETGTGHVMRMLALAQAWQRRGGKVHFAATEMPPLLVSRIRDEQIDVTLLGGVDDTVIRRGSEQDAALTAALARQLGAAWVVADGYVFDGPFQNTIRQAALRCAIVTDFDFCKSWDCDLILNQNPHAIQEPYASSVDGCKRLLGTQFVLLRREFLDKEAVAEARGGDDQATLLITLGGSDPEDATGLILQLLAGWKHSELSIRVIVGAANPHRRHLEELAAMSKHRVELLVNVQDMPRQYQWADGIVSAGGSSCWEWLYFGLPGAIVVIADNQAPIYRELTSVGAATGLGTLESLQTEESAAREALEQFLERVHPGQRDPTRYRHLVDGHGASRVAAALDSGVWLRCATENDRQLYFDWANDPDVRLNSLCSDKIEWQSHCEWFDRQLATTDARLLVGMREDRPVGQIRFNRTHEDEWNVGFSVANDARGTGVGKELVRLGTGWMSHERLSPLVATVKVGNQASARCFIRLGWAEIPTDDSTLLRFRLATC